MRAVHGEAGGNVLPRVSGCPLRFCWTIAGSVGMGVLSGNLSRGQEYAVAYYSPSQVVRTNVVVTGLESGGWRNDRRRT